MLVSADKIHDGHKWLPEGAVIDIGEDGVVKSILDEAHDNVRKYKGVVCPGFVNAHCHLELSHMKGQIPEHTGLEGFLETVMSKRNGFTEEDKTVARHDAFRSMLNNGIVAVGDIANTTDTLDLRVQNKIHFQTFVEAIGFNPTPQKQFDYAVAVYHAFAAQQKEEKEIQQSIVPHAPYSVSKELFGLIDSFGNESPISIHNQETLSEDEYYRTKSGRMQKMLQGMGIDDAFFKASGKSSLQTYMEYIQGNRSVVLVHNTCSEEQDVQAAESYFDNVSWCLCPNANKYIESKLPDIPMLKTYAKNICIGTDSLSSNHQLSVLAELQTIKCSYTDIEWEELLIWGTSNGAKALQMDDIVGLIEVGKKPRLVVIDDLDTGNVTEVI